MNNKASPAAKRQTHSRNSQLVTAQLLRQIGKTSTKVNRAVQANFAELIEKVVIGNAGMNCNNHILWCCMNRHQ